MNFAGQLWHFGVYARYIAGALNLGLAQGFIKARVANIFGSGRYGAMPVHPGMALDKAVMVEAVTGQQNLRTERTRKYNIIPLEAVPENREMTPWQTQLAALVNTALNHKIDGISLTIRSDNAVEASWHHQDGSWEQSLLQAPADDGNEALFFLDWLVNSYAQQEKQSSFDVVSLLQPETLHSLEQVIRGDDTILPPSPLARVTRVDCDHQQLTLRDNSSYLYVLKDRSWSPGLPGVMALGEDISSAHESVRLSGQYRMPEWLAIVGEAMLYQAAVRVAEGTLGTAIEKGTRWWHGADQLTLVKNLQLSNRDGEAQVTRVKDAAGNVWIRKESPIHYNSAISPPFFLQAKERQILSELNDPHIVKVYDSWLENAGTDRAALVFLEEDAGTDARSYLEAVKYRYEGGLVIPNRFAVSGTVEIPKERCDAVRNILRGALQAMKTLRKKGIAFFDMKPENIAISDNGDIKLIDFGGAAHCDSNGRALMKCLTYSYCAPEAKINKVVPWQADIWSLGATAKNLLGGNRTKKSATLQNFLQKMMNDDYQNRPSFTDLLQHPFLRQND